MIKTRIVFQDELTEEDIKYGAELINKGELVAFGTETVYGLGANGLDEKAIEKIYIAKGRPSDNPLILHVSDKDMAKTLTTDDLSQYSKLLDKFWPGPLTIVVPRSDAVPDKITAGLDTVAIRMPKEPLAKRLIELSGVPIAAPSANISGRPSPTDARTVYEDLNGKIPLILDSGPTKAGIESTVLDLSSGIPTILRPGSVTLEDLQAVLDNVTIDPHIVKSEEKPKSPGQKYTHYAPEKPAFLLKGPDKLKKLQSFLKKDKNYGYMVSDELAESIDLKDEDVLISYGSRKNLQTIAENIFRILRRLDKEEIDIIIIEETEDSGVGLAIMNRLKKSTGGKEI